MSMDYRMQDKDSRYLNLGRDGADEYQLPPDIDLSSLGQMVSHSWDDGRDSFQLLAYQYYGTTKLAWLIMEYNNIFDPYEKINSGTPISIPNNLSLEKYKSYEMIGREKV